MLRSIASSFIIAVVFCGAMYTTAGCGKTPTEPSTPATLQGGVINAQTMLPLSGVTVTASTPSVSSSAITDINGHYTMTTAVGSIHITASKSGFKTFNADTITMSGATSTFDIGLQPGQ